MEKIRVLIADDVGGFRDLLKTQLRRHNCEICREVADGRNVVDAIRQEEPDIVFLDINMPGKTGLEVLKEIRDFRIHDNVWVVSGEADKATVQRAKEFGAKHFISKPIKVDSIARVLTTYQNGLEKEQESGGKFDDVKTTTVTIADDEDLMIKLLEKTLCQNHCEVKEKAYSGEEIIEIMKQGNVTDMTFLDIEMPGISGLDVLEYIKKNGINTFTVIVSAHGTFDNVKIALEAGADGFIVKPYSEKKVKQIVAKYRNQLNQEK